MTTPLGENAPGEAPDTTPLDRSLTYRLHQLHKLTDLESQHAYVRDAGLSLSDGRCLAAIGSFEPLSIKDLARLANLNKSQASRAAQALVEQGLVIKQGSTEDARGVILMLSKAGREVWTRTMDLVRVRNQQIFGCLNTKEQAVLSKLLDRLIQHNLPN